MEQLYFIRHGNANYVRGCLTPRGVQQVERLSSTLETLLPKNIQGTLISSSSGRAIETAEILLPLLERKTGRKIKIEREPLLSEVRSMGSDKTILEECEVNTSLIEKYNCFEYGFFVAHEKVIAATCRAIVERYGLPMPNFLKLIEDQPDEETIDYFIKKMKCSREEALVKIRGYNKNPWIELPPIAEASAIHLDIQQKQGRYILPH